MWTACSAYALHDASAEQRLAAFLLAETMAPATSAASQQVIASLTRSAPPDDDPRIGTIKNLILGCTPRSRSWEAVGAADASG